MNVSYKKLWKLLIDKDMKKKDLREAAGISAFVNVILIHSAAKSDPPALV